MLDKFARPAPVQWLQMVCLSFYGIVGWFVLGFLRPVETPWTVIYCLALDFALNILFVRRNPDGKIKFPVTGLVAGIALTLLLEGSQLKVYLIAGSVAILSKTLIRYKGKHVFNPANFGLLSAVLLFPEMGTANIGQWSGDAWFLLVMICTGLTLSIVAKRWVLSLSYLISFLVVSGIFSVVKNLPLAFMPGTLLGLPALLFSFHMITDPMTSPNSRRGQFFMGALIAVLDLAFRANKVLYAPFLAVAMITALSPLFDYLRSHAWRESTN